MSLIKCATDQRARSYHGFRLQHRAFEHLNITACTHTISDTYIARAIEPLTRNLVEDRVLVARADNDIRGQHAIPAGYADRAHRASRSYRY